MKELMLLNCGVWENSWESLGLQGNQPWIFIGMTDAEAPIVWPPDVKSQLISKDPDAGKDWRQEKKGTTENEMVGCHHWLNGCEFEQALGDGDRHGSLTCCNPWVTKSQTHLSDWTVAVHKTTFINTLSIAMMFKYSKAKCWATQCISKARGFWSQTRWTWIRALPCINSLILRKLFNLFYFNIILC